MQQLSIFQKRHPSRGEFTPCWETLPYELQSKNHCHKEKKSNRNSLQMKLSLLGIYLQDANWTLLIENVAAHGVRMCDSLIFGFVGTHKLTLMVLWKKCRTFFKKLGKRIVFFSDFKSKTYNTELSAESAWTQT